MLLADSFSLLVLGQGKSGLDVARWALAHPERVSAVTVYGGGASEPNDATRALEAAGASFVYGTEQVEGAYDACVTCPGISEFSAFFKAGREHAAGLLAGVVLNAGACTHTSVALLDAIKGTGVPLIELHISNVFARESFRHHSWISPAARGVICGLGVAGYALAIDAIAQW